MVSWLRRKGLCGGIELRHRDKVMQYGRGGRAKVRVEEEGGKKGGELKAKVKG